MLKDEISKEEEETLKKSNKIDMMREKAINLLEVRRGLRKVNDRFKKSSELSRRNFYYNEENIVRLCYLFAIQLKLEYEQALGFLKLNSATERIDFLLKTVEGCTF